MVVIVHVAVQPLFKLFHAHIIVLIVIFWVIFIGPVVARRHEDRLDNVDNAILATELVSRVHAPFFRGKGR